MQLSVSASGESSGGGVMDVEVKIVDSGTVGSGIGDEVRRDGMKLHPQPTVDPLDPLNWSWTQKNTILAIVMLKYDFFYFLFTSISFTTPHCRNIYLLFLQVFSVYLSDH